MLKHCADLVLTDKLYFNFTFLQFACVL